MIKEISYYFVICILVRLLLAYSVYKNYKNKIRYVFIIFYLLLGLGSLYHFIKNDRSIGAFSQKVWWQNYRIIHTILFLGVCILLYKKNKNAWKLLLIDTLISIYGHITNRYFQK